MSDAPPIIVQIEALRDEGYDDDDIEQMLGVDISGLFKPKDTNTLAHSIVAQATGEEPAVPQCKRPGCTNPSTGAALGPYSGLCEPHTEEARKQRAQDAQRRELERRDTVPAHVYEAERDSESRGADVEESRNGGDPDSHVNQDDGPERAERLLRKDEIVAHLQSLYRRLRREPTAKDIDRAGVVESRYVIRRFGSVGAALKQAGIVDNPLVVGGSGELTDKTEAGPAPRKVRDFRSDSDRPLSVFGDLRLDAKDEERLRMIKLLSTFDREAETLDMEVLSGGRGNSQVAVRTTDVPLSRGVKVLRIAEALSRMQDRKWWELRIAEKRRYVMLADRALTALELVEYEHDQMVRQHGARF